MAADGAWVVIEALLCCGRKHAAMREEGRPSDAALVFPVGCVPDKWLRNGPPAAEQSSSRDVAEALCSQHPPRVSGEIGILASDLSWTRVLSRPWMAQRERQNPTGREIAHGAPC